GVVLDDRQAFVIHDLEGLQRAGEERRRFDVRSQARGLPPGAAAGPAPPRFAHDAPCRFARRLRRGVASSESGKPMARTKCAWNAGSIAVSIFTIRRVTLAISSRAARDSNARTAPPPAALPTLRAIAGSQEGISPSTMAYEG